MMNNLTEPECPSSSKIALEYQNASAFHVKDIVAVLGILGNIATAVILMQRHMRNTFNKLLVALAFFDTTLLVTSFAYSCVWWASKKAFMIAFPYILWPMRCFAMTSSTFMTVVIATERFIAVCHPLRYKNNRHHRVLKHVTTVTILAMVFTASKFWEYEPNNCSVIRVTKLYKNNVYIIYIYIYKFLVTGLIPGIVLVFLYVKIYRAIKASHVMQRRCTLHASAAADNESNETMRRMENKQAGVYAGVVITFLICNIPDAFVKIVYIMKTVKSTADPPQWFLRAIIVRDFFFILNSSINCLIYTCFSNKFRNEIRMVLCRLTGNDITLASSIENYLPNSTPMQHQYGNTQQHFV